MDAFRLLFLLKEIPGVGPFLALFWPSGPFDQSRIFNPMCFKPGHSFFVAPIIALKGINRIQIAQILSMRLKMTPLQTLF